MSEPLRSDKKTLFGAAINPPVFLGSLAILLIGITTTVIVGEPMEDWFASAGLYSAILVFDVVFCGYGYWIDILGCS